MKSKKAHRRPGEILHPLQSFCFHAIKVHFNMWSQQRQQYFCYHCMWCKLWLACCSHAQTHVRVHASRLSVFIISSACTTVCFMQVCDCVCMRVHRSSVSPSKGMVSSSMWMFEWSSLQTQPMGVRLNEGRERMSACRVGRVSGSSVAVLTSGSSKVNILDALSKPPKGIAILGKKEGKLGGWGQEQRYSAAQQ